ncbi:MAG TPA: nitroreductase family protein [Methylomirabilota bacterium]|nr:nitroreductase family protein [Methylomirabilota bacterium]
MFQDKPSVFPKNRVDGKAMKSLTQTLLDRRATSHFKSDPVPDEYLEAILQFAAQAPSGYNIQPWRFIVVREKENRERLKKAAYNQEKVGEAPVIIIAFAIKDDWKNYIDAIFQEGVRRGYGKPEMIPGLKKQASDFLEKGIPAPVWLNRHTMIAVTTMMLMAEAYGLDTAPMEGFDPAAVGREFGLPENAEVIGLLAIGCGAEPDKPYGGRLALSEIVHDEHFGRHWKSDGKSADQSSKEMFEEIERKAKKVLQPA